MNDTGKSAPIAELARGDSTEERYVLFLDILGFKDRIARHSHEEVMATLLDLQDSIYSTLKSNEGAKLQSNIFSDSILLFTPDDSRESLEALSQVTCNIMQTAITAGVPLKGALARGKVTCNPAKQLFFGQALIDAYLLEESTKYYGILVHHSAEAAVRDYPGMYRDVQANLKSGTICHYELNWHSRDDETKQKVLDALERLRCTVSDEPRKYIDNTRNIVNTK